MLELIHAWSYMEILFSTCLFRLQKTRPPKHMWKPRTMFFSVSPLMHFQVCNHHLSKLYEEQFQFLWDDYGLFLNPGDATAAIKGMNILTKILTPLVNLPQHKRTFTITV